MGSQGFAFPRREIFGGVCVIPSHQTSLSSVSAVLVKIVFFSTIGERRIVFFCGSWSYAKKSVFRIDRIESAVFSKMEPGDVIADAVDRPSRKKRLEHGEIRFAAAAGKEAVIYFFSPSDW